MFLNGSVGVQCLYVSVPMVEHLKMPTLVLKLSALSVDVYGAEYNYHVLPVGN